MLFSLSERGQGVVEGIVIIALVVLFVVFVLLPLLRAIYDTCKHNPYAPC